MSVVKWLSTRRLIHVAGSEASNFLQGLLTNDINLVSQTSPIYSFILNVKGRIVHDVFVYSQAKDEFLLEVDQKACSNLERMLKVYRLRRKVDISPVDKLNVGFTLDSVSNSMEDPRVPGFGRRILGDFSNEQANGDDNYLMRRLEWGIPEGPTELSDQIPLNANGDIMNGINFDKGCYVGQELIARTHHTGVVRRRVLPFKCSEQVTGQIVGEDGRKQGKVIRSIDKLGICLLPIKSIGEKLFVDKVPIDVYKPSWWPKQI